MIADQSPKFSLTMCEDSNECISSAESQDGISPSDGQVGKGQSGPVPVRVSRFRAQDSERAMPTNATCGPLFNTSSPSADLGLALENRLRARMAGSGSPLYALTWSQWDMPAGPPICRQRASGRRTSGNGSTGWPTPNTPSGGRSVSIETDGRGGTGTVDGKKHTASLEHAVKFVGWPTPQASTGGPEPEGNTGRKLATVAGWPTATTQDTRQYSDESLTKFIKDGQVGGHSLDLNAATQMSGWATPRVTTNSGHGNPERATDGKARLEDQVQGVGWATPTSRDHKDGASTLENTPVNSLLGRQVLGTTIEWLPCADGKARPTQPGLQPLVTGLPTAVDGCGPIGRVGTLRGAGNSIVPELAALFIRAYMERNK